MEEERVEEDARVEEWKSIRQWMERKRGNSKINAEKKK